MSETNEAPQEKKTASTYSLKSEAAIIDCLKIREIQNNCFLSVEVENYS